MSRPFALTLFLIVATAFNVLVSGIALFSILALWSLVGAPLFRNSASAWIIVPALPVAIILSGILYNFFFKMLDKRHDLSRKLGLKTKI